MARATRSLCVALGCIVLTILAGCSSHQEASPPPDERPNERIETTSEAVSSDGGTSDAGDSGAPGSLSFANLELQVLPNACAANLAQDYFQIKNNGTTAVALSDLTIKYWIDDTSGFAVTPSVYTGGCETGSTGCFHQATGVHAAATHFSPACGPDPAHQADWEIAITNTDSTLLPGGTTWTNIQTAVNLSTYANFAPGTANWYSPCGSGGAYADNSHFALYYKGSLVFSSGVDAPSCRAPQGSQVLSGYTPPTAGAPLVGPVAPATVLNLALGLPVQNAQAFQSLAQGVSDPKSPLYGQYPTASQFASTYEPTQASYNAVVAFATSNGLTVTTTYPNRAGLDLTGTAAQIEQAFFANLNVYQRPDGTQFFAPDRVPSFNLAVPLLGIGGFDNFAVVQTETNGSGPGGSLSPQDLRRAYTRCATSLTGSGQSVGILAYGGFNPATISSFETTAGVNVPVTPVSVKSYSLAVNPATEFEVELDIEEAMTFTPGLAGVFVFEADPNSATRQDDISLQIQQPAYQTIKQFSSSFSEGVDSMLAQALQTLANDQQSYFVASGDDGAYPSFGPTDSAGGPAIQWTFVGGTVLTMDDGASYQGETAWPGSGGGNESFQTPSFQAALLNATTGGPALSGASLTFENFPDVAMAAVGLEFGSETSAATPLWASFLALANEARANQSMNAVGWANPALYNIANSAAYASAFNDITSGVSLPNALGATNAAVRGYDLVTGLGSPQCSLIYQLASATPTVPVCSGGLSICNGACLDFTSDANNCGACGHGCGGGTCSSGVCQSLLLGIGFESGGLAVGGGEAYWTGSNTFDASLTGVPAVFAAPTAGGPTITIQYPYTGGIALTSDGMFVYYWTAGSLWKASPTTAPVALTAASEPIETGLAVDNQNLYWVDANGNLSQVQLSTGTVSPIQGGVTSGIASDGTNLYYFTDNSLIMFNDNGSDVPAFHQTLAEDVGQGDQPSWLGFNGGGMIAAANNVACWIAVTKIECASFLTPSTSPEIVYTCPNCSVYGLATDGSNVFFGLFTNSPGVLMGYGIYEYPISGGSGAPTGIAPGVDLPAWIAVDSQNLYWTTEDEEDQVFKLVRPL
jgi:kumamolisin